MTAVVECRCGKCSISFHDPKPRHRADCCCSQCQEAFDWADKETCRECGVPRTKDILYFTNDISIAKGEEYLKWFILRDEGTPRFYADCCKTVLGMVHPAYQGNLVMVYAQSGATISGVEMIPYDLRWFQYDLTPEELKANPTNLPSPGKNVIFPLSGFVAIFRFLGCVKKEVPLPRKGIDIKSLQDKFGKPLNAKLPLPAPKPRASKPPKCFAWCSS